MVIDILAVIILLFFFLKGWHKGFLLSLLGISRVVACYGLAYLSGRHIGYWLGAATHRPRLITIPLVALVPFALIAFAFHLVMHRIHARHKEKETEDDFQRPILSCLFGGAINLAAGTVSLILLLWIVDLFFVGVAGTSTPGADRSNFSRLARRAVYEAAYIALPKSGDKVQEAAIARTISNPGKGITHLENIFAANSVRQLLADKTFPKDLLSGDAQRIEQNSALQQVFNDRATLDELRELGIISGYETKSGLCQKMAAFGHNENIQASIRNLQARHLLEADKIHLLIRDPDFDAILAELIK